MRTFIILLFAISSLLCSAQEQESITNTIDETITLYDASYEGSLDDLYYAIYNNYTFQGISKSDLPEKAKGKTFFIFYVKFAISEDGKPFEFSGEEIDQKSPLYTEAVRVLSSTKWNTATENGQYKKQFVVIPIKVSTNDLK